MADTGTPLCTAAQFAEGPFGDLVSGFAGGVIPADFLLEATRMCEDAAGRRFVPFTVTETHRAEGMDPDEYGGNANLPMSIQGTLGQSYSQAIGAADLVRHCWLDERPPRYQEMWTYSNFSTTIIRSYGGSQVVPSTQILEGPDETGHVWFQLGLFLPVGSRIQLTFTAGYTTIPASLVRAGKYMAASIVVRELDPGSTEHDPDQLEGYARRALIPWGADAPAKDK